MTTERSVAGVDVGDRDGDAGQHAARRVGDGAFDGAVGRLRLRERGRRTSTTDDSRTRGQTNDSLKHAPRVYKELTSAGLAECAV